MYVLVWYKTTLPLLSKNYRYYQIYGNAEYTKILNKNQKIKKNIKIYEKLIRGISQEYSSSYYQATTQAKKLLLLKQKQKHYSY